MAEANTMHAERQMTVQILEAAQCCWPHTCPSYASGAAGKARAGVPGRLHTSRR